MKILTAIAAALLIITAFGVATFLLVGAERFWRLFGEPDLGPVSFERLERRSTPNDALACPPGFCEARADDAALSGNGSRAPACLCESRCVRTACVARRGRRGDADRSICSAQRAPWFP